VVGATARGSAHESGGLPNQDSFGWAPDGHRLGGPFVLAVADGHGSAASYRSAEGSAVAVRVALAEGAGFLAAHRGDRPDALVAALRGTLGVAVVDRWQSEVLDLAVTTPDERLPEERFGRLRVFGSTVVVAVIADHAIGILQLGDGDALILDRAAGARTVVADDPRLRLNVTTSLCMPDAVAQIRYAAVPRTGTGPLVVMLSTDGYSNSFATRQGFLEVAPDLWNRLLADGPQQVADQLGGWLGRSAEVGGDDVTLVAALADLPEGSAARTPVPLPARSAQTPPGPVPRQATGAGTHPGQPGPTPPVLAARRQPALTVPLTGPAAGPPATPAPSPSAGSPPADSPSARPW
jgi:hypothetical protein